MCPFNFGYVVLSEVNCVRSTGGTIYYYLFIYYYASFGSDILSMHLMFIGPCIILIVE